jgi:hypothetical protein
MNNLLISMKLNKKGEEGIPWTMLAIIVAVAIMLIGIIMITTRGGTLFNLFNRMP